MTIDPRDRLAFAWLTVAQRLGWTPREIKDVPPGVLVRMADILAATTMTGSAISINEARAAAGEQPAGSGTTRFRITPDGPTEDPDDDGTDGTREPRNPKPTPVSPTTTATSTGSEVMVTVTLDSAALFRSMLPHIDRENQQYKRRHGYGRFM